jgi:hypothetical protein
VQIFRYLSKNIISYRRFFVNNYHFAVLERRMRKGRENKNARFIFAKWLFFPAQSEYNGKYEKNVRSRTIRRDPLGQHAERTQSHHADGLL